MASKHQKCCCGETDCIGCCFPFDALGVGQDMTWEISAPSCAAIHGQTGTFSPSSTPPHDSGGCGICLCYVNSLASPLSISGFAKTEEFAPDDCVDTPCTAEICFNVYCPNVRANQGDPTLEQCCRRIELLVQVVGLLAVTGGDDMSVDVSDCPYDSFEGCQSEQGIVRKLLPVACQCFEESPCQDLEITYDLSELTLGSSATYSGGPCDGELIDCVLSSCSLAGATLVLRSNVCP